MDRLPEYEKIGSFYLGKKYELTGRQLLEEKVLYDAKDLTTHALCVGMTGSGKTGLCLSLLEEAAIDGIPAICIDPKGDLGNLMLAFPEFRPTDFAPWLEPSEAARKGITMEQHAAQTAEQWKSGLAAWGQDADRVRRYRDAVDVAIYTPGSSAGIPMTVLKSFDVPPPEIMNDPELMRERVAGVASGILTLMGIDADPLSSREHILLANIFDFSWRQGQSLHLPSLIRSIQSPPIEKIGVFDMESFFPAAERLKLSMQLNSLLASPTFAGWLEGQSLDIQNLLYTEQGKPRLSILSIAHLGDSERMFFVTMFLNELLGWMRTQPGTSSLRAIFYMDEIFGYFPPTSKPPSKPPMLVLLKQARAFGLGVVLATQNPVDLDYKGLSNIGTWFLGRLQTQRDKERVLEGLEGAAAQTGGRFDRGAMAQTLAGLGSRVFLMNNVHEDQPTIFQTRWAMSFLRGPLSRIQIQQLMDPRREELTPPNAKGKSASAAEMSVESAAGEHAGERPMIPLGIEERFWVASKMPTKGARRLYRPSLLGDVSCHYVRASADLDDWFDRSLVCDLKRRPDEEIWKESKEVVREVAEISEEPESEFGFGDFPAEILNVKQFKAWEKDLRNHLYRNIPLRLFRCEELNATSKPGQNERDARAAWAQMVREHRDAEKEKLLTKYAAMQRTLEGKILTAERRLERETAQYNKEKWSTLLNFGQTVLGAILGNKISSRTVTTGRSIGRAAQQRTDVVQVDELLEQLAAEKRELEQESEREIRELGEKYRLESLTLEPLDIPCRKGDIQVKSLAILWVPWEIDADGFAAPLVESQQAVKQSQRGVAPAGSRAPRARPV